MPTRSWEAEVAKKLPPFAKGNAHRVGPACGRQAPCLESFVGQWFGLCAPPASELRINGRLQPPKHAMQGSCASRDAHWRFPPSKETRARYGTEFRGTSLRGRGRRRRGKAIRAWFGRRASDRFGMTIRRDAGYGKFEKSANLLLETALNEKTAELIPVFLYPRTRIGHVDTFRAQAGDWVWDDGSL